MEERNENIPETKRVKDRRVTLENSLNEFKGFITNILQVSMIFISFLMILAIMQLDIRKNIQTS